MIQNIIRIIGDRQTDGIRIGFDLARHIADEHEKKTGNKCVVRRILYRVDQFSFDVVELVDDQTY